MQLLDITHNWHSVLYIFTSNMYTFLGPNMFKLKQLVWSVTCANRTEPTPSKQLLCNLCLLKKKCGSYLLRNSIFLHLWDLCDIMASIQSVWPSYSSQSCCVSTTWSHTNIYYLHDFKAHHPVCMALPPSPHVSCLYHPITNKYMLILGHQITEYSLSQHPSGQNIYIASSLHGSADFKCNVSVSG